MPKITREKALKYMDKISKHWNDDFYPSKRKFEKLERKGILKKIFICPSHQCNANCSHCYEKFTHQKFNDSLTTDEIKDVIDQFDELKGKWIFFCSGEFLLRNDVWELLKYACDRIKIVSLVTNGIMVDEEVIDRLIEIGVINLIISIDSADEKKHDKNRGTEGCFDKACKALSMARKKGMITFIWTYVSKSNFDQLDGVIELGNKLNVDTIFVYFTLLSGNLFNKFEENLTFEDRQMFREKYIDTPRVLMERPSENSVCTGGGVEHVCVMPTGDVTFCPPVPYSYGNIKNDSLKDSVKKLRKDFKRFFLDKYTGQCPVNFKEYRENNNAKFIYKK